MVTNLDPAPSRSLFATLIESLRGQRRRQRTRPAEKNEIASFQTLSRLFRPAQFVKHGRLFVD